MVLTRSKLVTDSPRKPPTPKSRRKARKEQSDDKSIVEDNTVILEDVKKCLIDDLDTINEEDENAIDERDNAINGAQTSPIDHEDDENRTRNSNIKAALEIPDTIVEENGEDVVDKASDESIKNLKMHAAESTSGDSASSSSTSSKQRFYFPPPKTLVPSSIISTSIDAGMEMPDTYIDVKGSKEGKKKIDQLYAEVTVNPKNSRVKDTVITPDFERNDARAGEKSIAQLRRERRIQKEATAGNDWFNLKPPEMTDDVKRDLKILQMRGVLDPKRFYKHNDRRATPRYFQVGKFMDNAADFYSARVPKKQRKPNLTEELLADAQFQKYQKRKYNEIQMQKKARGAKERRIKRRMFGKKRKETVG